ncbi:MAG TPA: LPXTG cell wall anchor domain-containing protein, partial [Candidatus Faecousia intestinigallinarum]|nr:LPXTG cell wall anchor domain-containing protein [Candidatus Faecousia intestinigallinarum]
GTYDIHVTRAADADWNELDTVLKDCLTITKQTDLIQWSDLELTANPGDTLADVEKPAYLVSPLDGKQIPGTFYWVDDEGTSVGELGDRTGFKFRFVPDMPLSAELAALYDFSDMPENGFDGTESNYPFTAYVTVKEASEIPGSTDPIDLPVRMLEEGDMDYSPAPELSATFTPDTAVTVGEFNQWQGLAIDYYNPMVDAELSEGYDIQAGYTVSIPLTDYEGETLSGTLTIPLPKGYDGATARIKNGAAASSYTATTVTFPLTLDVSGNTAEAFELLIEYKEAQEPVVPDAPVIIKGANGTWQKGGKDGLSFTSNAAFADFIKVQVDGKDLDASNYTVKEGSTIVTLNAAYLNTLSVGKHTLSIVSANGTATTEFTITAAQTGGDQTGDNQTGGDSQTGGDDTTTQDPDKNDGATSSPQTGDNSNVLLWIAILFVSGSGLFGATIYRRKRKIK